MLRTVFLVQAIIYLLVAPLFRQGAEPYFDAPLLASLVALAGFVAGIALFRAARPNTPASLALRSPPARVIVPQRWLPFAILALAALYSYVALSAGLVNRRLGSEYMAEVYGSLPLWQLAAIRIYEIILVPIVVIFFVNDRKVPVMDKVIVGVAVLTSIPFMGIADSRGRLLVIFLAALTFLPLQALIRTALHSIKFQVVAAATAAVLLIASLDRSARYGRFADFLYYEVFFRLDGLNLVAALRDAGILRPWGTYDIAMLGPLISRIPFLDAAREAKLAGITSTKQYLLRFMLLRSEIDAPSSIITDPMYFAGYPGAFLAFGLLGYGAYAFDRRIGDGRLFSSQVSAAAMLAFGASLSTFEADLFGMPTNFLIMFVLCLGLTLFCTRWVTRTEDRNEPRPTQANQSREGVAPASENAPALP